MAMKSARNRCFSQCLFLPILLLMVLMVGCGSTPVQQTVSKQPAQDAPLTTVDTTQYIPRRTTNPETGQLIPYQAMTNPYLVPTGRIEVALVTEFIAARRAYQSGAYQQAKNLLEKLTKQDKTLSGPWVMLANISKKNKKPKEAIANYKKAIEINHNNVNAYLGLARLYREQGEFIFAQNTYQKALSVWKDFPEAHLNLSILYDLYFNKPLMSQRHLEAYLFLNNGRDKKREGWLKELQQRTGKTVDLKVEVKKAISVKSI